MAILEICRSLNTIKSHEKLPFSYGFPKVFSFGKSKLLEVLEVLSENNSCRWFQIPHPHHPHPAHAKRLNRANMSDYIGPPQSLEFQRAATRIVHIGYSHAHQYTNYMYDIFFWLGSIHISYNILVCVYVYISIYIPMCDQRYQTIKPLRKGSAHPGKGTTSVAWLIGILIVKAILIRILIAKLIILAFLAVCFSTLIKIVDTVDPKRGQTPDYSMRSLCWRQPTSRLTDSIDIRFRYIILPLHNT